MESLISSQPGGNGLSYCPLAVSRGWASAKLETRYLVSYNHQRAFVLLAVLIVIMLASMVAISLLFRLRADETAGAAGAGSEQAWAVAVSGAQEAMRLAANFQPGSTDWRDNETVFKNRLILDDGSDRWYFSIYSPGTESEQAEIRWGLTDEASKLDLNEASEAMLMRVPGLKPSQAQGLYDFLDADNAPRPEGAEQEYYDGLATP